MATTETAGPRSETSRLVRRFTLTFVGMLGVSAALTIMFFAMRSVMEIGGSCASGNTPYEISRPCPDGVAGLMVGSIFLGLVFLGVYAVSAVGPNLTLLAWPALFLSLGWNFLEYGVDPPGANGGVVWGWLLCGVIFMLMGGLPLVFGIKAVLAGRETRLTRQPRSIANRYGRGSASALEGDRAVWRWGLAVQLLAIVVGIWAGIELFEWGTGSTVTINLG